MAEDSQQRFELTIEPFTTRFHPDDERWRAQVSQLHSALADEIGGVRRHRVPVHGAKGGVETVILALGSAGAFTAAAEYLRAWLGRDKTRSLEVSWTADGHQHVVTIRGEAMDASSFRAVAEAAARRLEGRR